MTRRIVGYAGAHYRVRTARGPASEHVCIACRTAPASTWALRLTTLDVLTEVRNDRDMAYSLDIDNYMPMCRSCHTRYDRRHSDPAPHGKEILVDAAELADLHLIGQGSTLGRRGR